MSQIPKDKNLIQNNRQPLLYLITGRRQLPDRKSDTEVDTLLKFVERAVVAGVHMVQVRERDLPARTLYFLAKRITEIAGPYGARVFINDRADIAAACGAGVHLTTRSMRPRTVRDSFGDTIFIGASTHSLAEAQAAEAEGADFIVFGPVFETASKKIYGTPVGLEALREAVTHLKIPVIALGGLKMSNYREALETGCAGIAAISLFTGADDLRQTVRMLRES